MSAGAIQIRLECVYCRSAVVFPAERVQQESFGVGEMRTAVVALVPFGGGMIGQWCREFSDAHVGCKAKKEAEAERLKGGWRVSDYLGFVCHTCRKRTAPLGDRMNRQWQVAKEAVRLRIHIRDACRAVRRIEAEKTPWTIQVHFGISYSGGPKPDLHFPEFDAWFEAHAEHDMEACGEWEYTPHDSDPTHGVYEDE